MHDWKKRRTAWLRFSPLWPVAPLDGLLRKLRSTLTAVQDLDNLKVPAGVRACSALLCMRAHCEEPAALPCGSGETSCDLE